MMKEFISEKRIQQRVQELGQLISSDYQGKELTVVCILKGSFIFCADLVRRLSVPAQVEFLRLSSYGKKRESSGKVEVLLGLKESLAGKHVLIVEDIVDTGLTLATLMEDLQQENPASLKLVSLLLKPSKLEHPVTADYVGFEIEDKFVVGYGLDDAEKYRELPFIGVVEHDQ